VWPAWGALLAAAAAADTAPTAPPAPRAGIVRTPLQDKASPAFVKSWISWALAAVNGQTPRRGAISTLYAATEPWLQGAWVPAGGGRRPFGCVGCSAAGWCWMHGALHADEKVLQTRELHN
jgi:hypothetical protein